MKITEILSILRMEKKITFKRIIYLQDVLKNVLPFHLEFNYSSHVCFIHV